MRHRRLCPFAAIPTTYTGGPAGAVASIPALAAGRRTFHWCKRSGATVSKSGRAVLRQAFKGLEQEVPQNLARLIRKMRHPGARRARIPVGLLLMAGGLLSFLPILGIWMLPLGLLLIANDVPALRKPVGRSTIWATQKWVGMRQRRMQAGIAREDAKAS
jgi:hypothetical protein